MKKYFCIIFILFYAFVSSQNSSFFLKSDTLNLKKRKILVYGVAGTYSISMIGLNKLWYSKYPKSSFHTVNDNKEWLQMDKIGHSLTAYQIGRIGINLMDWAGENKKNQLIYGASLGFVFLTTVEVFDGFSKEWGFSTGDMFANLSGMGLLTVQELMWKEQRITLKYSFHQTKYALQNPDLLGSNLIEQSIKDYNGQTYWLSFNLSSFGRNSKLPVWLNVAVGYGAEAMLHGNEIPADNRYRQFYLSLDVDLTRIKTNSNFLKSLFTAINFIKIPAPTISYSKKDNLKFDVFYY